MATASKTVTTPRTGPAAERAVAQPAMGAQASSPFSADFVLHSVMLLIGRVVNEILGFYNRVFVLQNMDLARIYRNLGHGFRKKGLQDRALSAYRELVRLNPKDWDAHFHMARIYGQLGEPELEVQAYMTVVKINPKHAESHYRIAMARNRAGNAKEAMESLNKALELAPKKHAWWYRLGVFEDKNGEQDKALEHIKKAIELFPRDAKYHQYLGFVYEGLGQHDEAVKHFKIVMELDGAADDEC